MNRKKCVFSIVLLMLYYKKCVFEASGKLLFNLLRYFCNMKIRGAILQKICVQNKRGLLFSLLSYFYNTENVCLKKSGAAF